MDKILDVFELYADSDTNRINRFNEKLNSTMKVNIEKDKPKTQYLWIDKMEETLEYLDNILRSPTRLIINEEEVVKIEKIKKVTVESIKHLSKNAGFIEDVEENGDVKPGKLLNVFKEETFNTYENRFIYTLIIKMLTIIKKEKQKMLKEAVASKAKERKKMEYKGSSHGPKEQVDIQIFLTATGESEEQKEEMKKQLERINALEKDVISLTLTNTYQTLEKEGVTQITPPLRKNNVILKNVNFQYAAKLWDFLINEMDKKDTAEKDTFSKEYMDKGKSKKFIDDTFLLDYLVMQCVENPEIKKRHKKEIIERLIANMVEKTIDVSSQLTEEQLKDIVARQYKIIKYKKQTTNKEIQEIFRKHITKYVQKINS